MDSAADQQRTTWHITFGTYGARLHGGERPTVERDQNRRGERFQRENHALFAAERSAMSHSAVFLTTPHQRFIQQTVPGICERGGWELRVCSAGNDHVHILLDIDRTVHGQKVRELLKRWLSQSLNQHFGEPASGRWWAKAGSTKAISDARYLENAHDYIEGQRAL
ncbi:MAG: transposase [Phycisphaerales bacterium]